MFTEHYPSDIDRLEARTFRKLPPGHACSVLHMQDEAAFEMRAWPVPLVDVNQVRRVALSYSSAHDDAACDQAVARLVQKLSEPLDPTIDRFLVGQRTETTNVPST